MNSHEREEIVISKEDYDSLLKRINLLEQNNDEINGLLKETEKIKQRSQDYLKKLATMAKEN